ncbi:MAG: nuclear transport factor 2 family protein [Azospira oryzae]|jgi:ketosteroid isomerase-like protein|nr:MAG: nuclear transport factor 2 family protein [Azospira oryzae]
MIRIIWLSSLIVLSLLFFLCQCAAPAADHSPPLMEASKAIAESNAIYFQAFVKGDSSLFIERYAEDACIMAPGSPPLCGSNAALEFYRTAYHDIKLRDGHFITTAIYGDGKEYVTEEGEWQSFDEHKVMFDHGKFLVLWKKTPKGWKMYRDSFSSNKN